MRWLGVTTKVFSVGNYRRERLGSLSEEWFDPRKNYICVSYHKGIKLTFYWGNFL
jgi:hypothetical protein